MKYIVMVILFAICICVGYYFYSKFDRRRKFFSSLVLFAEKLTLDINFSREKLRVLISNFDKTARKHLCGIDEAFLDFLDRKAELDLSIFKHADCLKQDEKELVLLFLKVLGRSDVENQTKEIKSFGSRFSESLEKSNSEFKKYGSMSIKLAIVAGLFVIVLLI